MAAVIDVHPEVRAALDGGGAVVALESTLVAHGMPYPDNLATARALEERVRARGATPATIAVLGGRPKVGLSAAELERLARAEGVEKLSRRDLAWATSRGADGATTVAATMILARLAGIRVFVTGGIGGVHRGASDTFDVSADLGELARTEVAVVCAGAKAILDLARTLEVLETAGVPVVGFGTDAFPAFYSRDSGLAVPLRVDTPAEAAALMADHWGYGLSSGIVLAVPVPAEHELGRDEVELAIDQALSDASKAGIRGKALTPFLLATVARLTGGRSLAANKALVLHNAEVGAEVALAYSALRRAP